MSRILAFDLETSNLKGNFGHILCACAKWVGEKKFALSMRIDQVPGFGKTPASYCNDKPIVQALTDLVDESQATVAHYGGGFDQPFLVTRALVHKLKPPAPIKLIDTWWYARKKLALTSNRLETLSHTLGCSHTKYKLPFEAWQLADHGCVKTLRKMEQYCQNDVDTLIDVYEALRPVIVDHPNVSGARARCGCPACGSKSLQARGFSYSKSFRTERFRCNDCGTWSKGKQEKL